jgi:cytochrome c oxidase cbb3-type subunit III
MSDFISEGWSLYISGIVVVSLLFCAIVLLGGARHKVIKNAEGKVLDDTGHVWDGDLRELNNPLPRWWMALFVITLVFAVFYLFFYPGFGSAAGSKNWTSANQYEQEVAAAKVTEAKVYAPFIQASIEDLANNPTAHAIGERLFLNNCAACHGSDARGSKGYPNLTDADWLYGGDPEKIIETITEGRQGQMPPLASSIGSALEIRQVANYVLSLSGAKHNAEAAALGQAKFMVCAACHGMDGKGNQAIGAPNLTDKVWLHGFGEDAVVAMITNGKHSVMPAQKERYSPEQIKVLAAYVWGFSNTEKKP